MVDTKDIQTQVKEIPAFTVLKNGSILKNIFLLRQKSAAAKSSPNQEPDEEILLVGRHPNCHITLEHPSISRYHLRIHSNPSSRTLSVVDLSSVHGTWVSGRRIEPGVHVRLKEGDTVKIGGSSRVYELHWVPLTQAYDGLFVPTVGTIKEGEEEETHEDEKHDADSVDDDVEGSDDVSLSNWAISVPNCFSSDTVEEHSQSLTTGNENDDSVSIQAPLDVSETTSATDVSDSLNNSEDQLNWLRDDLIKEDLFSVPNCSKPSCDDTEVEHPSPWKTGNQNGEVFTDVSTQGPVLVSEAISETEISDCVNKSEDELNWLRDNGCNEFDHNSHGTTKDDLVSIDLFSVVKTHEEDDLGRDIERSNETDIDNENEPENQQINTGSVPFVVIDGVNTDLGCEFEQMNHTKMMDESASMVPFDGVDMGIKSESVDQEMLKEDSVFVFPDVMDMGQEKTLTPDTSKDNEVHMNLQSVQNVSVSKNLYNSVDGKELEFYTPDKENKNPNACSLVLFDGVDMGFKSESVDHEMLKEEDSVFVFPNVMDMGQEKTLTPHTSKDNEVHMNLQSVQNVSVSKNLFNSVDGKELQFYTPDKENKNPNACSGKSLSKKAVNPTVHGEKEIFGFSQKLFAMDEGMNRELSTTDEGMNIENKVDPFMNSGEVLASSSEKENKSRQMIMEGSCNSAVCPQTNKKAIISSQNLAKTRWTMVVDTNSLLDHKSLKHLKLLEGIKGTRLFVPKIVVRELMDIKSQDSFFKRSSKKASLALKWIDECMMNTRWWIHEDDETVHSSTAVPEILEIALRLRKEVMDQKIIILSNNLTLKIKAMAEGIMCEAAEEFHESLVNPFSKRFMWVGSSARGLTWSCVHDDHDIVRQKYHGSGSNGSHGLKGLKLLARVNHVTN